jgi:exodeoxyribonuclease V alpha subunit
MKGVLHERLFTSDSDEFGVYRFEPDGSVRLITISGSLGVLDQGEHLALEGEWVDHPRFGKQFKVASFRLELPEREEGLIQLLGSGAIAGFGPVYAKRLVAHFGENTYEVLEHSSERLSEVKGLGKKKRQALLEFWKGRESTRKVMLSLSEAGIGYKQALKLQMAYGSHAYEVLQHQPYQIMHQVKGFGFQTVDRLAMRMGIEPQSLERRMGGLEHGLTRAEDEGHCFLPKVELLQQSSVLLQLSVMEMEEALDAALLEKRLVWVRDGIMRPEFNQMEKEVVQALAKSLRQPLLVPWDTSNVRRVLDRDGL